MRSFLTLCFFVVSYISSFAQSDTTHFDYAGNGRFVEVPKNEAKFFRLPLMKEGDRYKIEEYYINGKLRMSGYVNTPDSMLYDGYATEYYENGNKSEYGNYFRGVRIGQWKRKFEDIDKIWTATTYYNNGSDTFRVLRSFYKSGKLKRIEYKIKGQGRDSIHYEGVCYSETGDTIPFTPFEVMPEPGFDVNIFLGKNIRYPDAARENNIEGRVNVEFCVLQEGSIHEIKVRGKFDVSLAKEAVRVVKTMPKWKPGKRDDVAVKVYYTQPVTFRLE